MAANAASVRGGLRGRGGLHALPLDAIDRAFREADSDANGRVGLLELQAALRRHGRDLTSEEMAVLLHAATTVWA